MCIAFSCVPYSTCPIALVLPGLEHHPHLPPCDTSSPPELCLSANRPARSRTYSPAMTCRPHRPYPPPYETRRPPEHRLSANRPDRSHTWRPDRSWQSHRLHPPPCATRRPPDQIGRASCRERVY